MNRGLLIGGGLLLGGGLLHLATRRPAPLAPVDMEFAPEVITHSPSWRPSHMMTTPPPTMIELVKKGLTTVTDAAQAVWAKLKLPSVAAQNITKYAIGEILDAQLSGTGIPKAFVLGLIHTETGGTFDPYIYNWTRKDPATGKTSYPAAYADPNGVDAVKWAKPGDGGFAHDPHAVGLFQILDYWRLANGRKNPKLGPSFAGVPLPTLKSMLDPETNIRAGLANLKIQWNRLPAGMSEADKEAAAYFAHNQGGQPLLNGLAKASNKLSARDVIKAAGAGMAGAPLTVALATASRGALWAQLGDLKEALA